jgi:hypothetical protein
MVIFLRTLINRPTKSPYWLIIFAMISATSTSLNLYHEAIPASSSFNVIAAFISSLRLIDCLALLAICLSYPMQDIRPGPKVAPADPKTTVQPSRDFTSPEDAVTLWNWLTFDYLEPLFRLSGKGRLNDEEVWDLPPAFKHANLFGKYLRLDAVRPQQSLVWFLITSNSLDLIIDVALKTWTSVIGQFIIFVDLPSLLTIVAHSRLCTTLLPESYPPITRRPLSRCLPCRRIFFCPSRLPGKHVICSDGPRAELAFSSCV